MKNIKKISLILVIIICSALAGSTLAMWYINRDKVIIPKVYFQGDMSNMLTKSDERNIKIRYEDQNKEFETYAKIKFQGTSSLAYDKKNYTITLYEDENYESKNKILMKEEWGAQSKYCLKANWIDKTHSRNIITARIAATANEKYGVFANTPHNGTIDGFPIEVYLNDEFLGIYTWNIPKDEWLWNLDDENPNHIVIGAGNHSDTTRFKAEATDFNEDEWEVEVGQENEETLDKLNRLISFVKDSTDEEFEEDYELYIDKDAMLNYIAIYSVSEAIDNITKNLMLVTYDGKVWAPSLYDLDTTFGTDAAGNLLNSYEKYEYDMKVSLLFKRTVETFPTEVADRYFELRKDILTKENIMKEFEEFKYYIPDETFEKEAERWSDIPGESIEQISTFLDYRIPFIDTYMNELYDIENTTDE